MVVNNTRRTGSMGNKVQYVDIETGEILKANHAVENYIVIKSSKSTIKKEYVNFTKGFVTITKLCRKSNQGKLF